MSHTKARVIQYISLMLLFALGAAAYWYFSARAAVNLKTATKTGLVGYWSFDEGSGTKAGDASGSGNTGTLVSGPTWTTGKEGQGLSFDGSTSYVDLLAPASLNLSGVNQFTLSSWVYPTAVPNGVGVISEMYDPTNATVQYEIGFDMDLGAVVSSKLSVGFYDGTWRIVKDSVNIYLNEWVHIAGTWDGTILRLYKNGVLINSATTGGSLPATNFDKVVIGKRHDTAGLTDFFPGKIDESRIYNRALSAAEISSAYALGAAKLNTSQNSSLTSGLVGLWSFNGADVSGTTAYDRSGSANNGTLVSGPTATIGKVGQALSLDGTNDEMTTVTNQGNGSNVKIFTLSAWFKTSSASGKKIIGLETSQTGTGSTAYDRELYIGTDGKVYFYIYDGANKTAVSSATFTDNNWHHAVGVSTGDSGSITLYVDGVLQQTTAVGSIYASYSTSYWRIGGYRALNHPNAGDGYFPGSIDEVRVYSRALVAAEIQSLYDLGASNKLNTSQNTQATDGLVGLWSFNGADVSGTTAYDRSGNGYNGTLTNGPTVTIGKLGQALSLDGTNQYVSMGNTLDIATGDFTIAYWVKAPNTAQARVVVGKRLNVASYSQYTTGIGYVDGTGTPITSKTIYFFGYNGTNLQGVHTTGDVIDGNWHHVVVTRTSSGILIFIDGLSAPLTIDSVGVASENYTNTGNFNIGYDNGSIYYSGSVDEVRIYNRALSATEITALYNQGR